ncbi:MFS transporter [Anaerorudis cellulosivorans]|uniref:MFS transporter n=1 Tax=Anaerorudis cellulosivorans TaxID=3397862 RepID=UPI002220454C|nr:MFS transporter [Seramator thermalis]MCW1734251.1 MFS transporter [Seramator thermalis]
MKNKHSLSQLIPVMLAFFSMGFVDLVGIATNYVKNDFGLNDTLANLMPFMVFLWFLVFSVPTGILMNKIGRRKTVILSLIVTIVALMVPLVSYSFFVMLIAFSLLGIGNTLMQVSLNPLVSNIVSGNKLASTLTFGQFVKAIASFLAPIIAGWAAIRFGDWKILYPIFSIIAIVAALTLSFTKIAEKPVEHRSTFGDCFALLKDPYILMLFLGIMVHVGIDVGINTTAPKLLIERVNMPLSQAGYATSIYFLLRTIGALSGSFILAHYSARKFFHISVALIVIAVIGLYFGYSSAAIFLFVALIGYGNSNIFSIMFSQALLHLPERNNEISGLMIMGLAGGAVFPLLMGVASDVLNSQTGAVIILTVCVSYLVFLSPKLKKDTP